MILGQESHLPLSSAQPIRLHVEAKEDIPMFADEFTEVELVRQLKATPGHKAIIGKEEASPFLNSYWEGHERKTGLTLKG